MDHTASALDTLVAEQVMALVPCDAWEPINLGSAGGPALLKRCSAPHHCYPRDHPMAFSSLIAAAWHIVDHLAEQGWETIIRRAPDWENPTGLWRRCWPQRPPLPRARCLGPGCHRRTPWRLWPSRRPTADGSPPAPHRR